jgi:hypothetical protein
MLPPISPDRAGRQGVAQALGDRYNPDPSRDWSTRDGAIALAEIITCRSKEFGAPLECRILQVVPSHTGKGAGLSVWGIRSKPVRVNTSK